MGCATAVVAWWCLMRVAYRLFEFRSKNEQGDKSDLSSLGEVDKVDKAYFPLCALSVWTHNKGWKCRGAIRKLLRHDDKYTSRSDLLVSWCNKPLSTFNLIKYQLHYHRHCMAFYAWPVLGSCCWYLLYSIRCSETNLMRFSPISTWTFVGQTYISTGRNLQTSWMSQYFFSHKDFPHQCAHDNKTL